MLADLSLEQRALAEYMSELSEKAYHAGWESGLEYALWHAVIGGSSAYGQTDLTREQPETLKKLSDRCGGWIISDDANEERFIPADEWKTRYEMYRAQR